MAEPRRPPPAVGAGPGGPGPGRTAGRNKSFRKAREAAEEAQYHDMSMDDVQKYFSPDTWKKMTNMHLNSVPPSSVQKYFDPVAWEKLQRLGCLRGRPSPSGSSSRPSSSAPPAPDLSVTAARNCFSQRSWETLARLNVVPMPDSPRCPRRGGGLVADLRGLGEDEDDDGFLSHDMDDTTSLSSAVRLEGLEDRLMPAPRAAVSERLKQYFSEDQWRKMEKRGVVDGALTRLGKETSV